MASRRSAVAAESSAREAAEVARIEAERRHDELLPDWKIEGREIEHDLVEFRLMVRGPANSYKVGVKALPGSVVSAIRRDSGGTTSFEVLDLGEVEVGADVVFFGNVSHGRGREMRALVSFERDGERWEGRLAEFALSWIPRIY